MVQSHIMQRLTQLEVRVTSQGAEITALRAEVTSLKSSAAAEDAPRQGMTDAEDMAPLRPALTRAEIDDLLEDTASEPDADAGPLEDQWAYRAADL